jgi:hypothetical protein
MSPAIADLPEYCTLFSQCFSPDGSFLAVGDHKGRVAVYKVSAVVGRSSEDPAELVHVVFAATATALPALSLTNSKEDLIVGKVFSLADDVR